MIIQLLDITCTTCGKTMRFDKYPTDWLNFTAKHKIARKRQNNDICPTCYEQILAEIGELKMTGHV